MDARRESRQQIYTRAKVTLVDNAQREQDCSVLDISSEGVKFVAGEKLQPDEMIVLDVEDRLVLADVRYSEPRGDRYVIGAERIHAVAKASLPPSQTKGEQILLLVDDYRARIRAAIVTPQPQREDDGQYRDHIVTAAVQQLLRQWAKESEDSTSDGTLRAAIVERKAR